MTSGVRFRSLFLNVLAKTEAREAHKKGGFSSFIKNVYKTTTISSGKKSHWELYESTEYYVK